MAYADVTDLEERWRTLSADEQARAAVLLEDASAMLSSMVVVDDSDQQQASILRMVCCNMVARVMSAGADAGVTQASMTGGPYTQSWTYEAPVGAMYLTRTEKTMLGVVGSAIGYIRPMMRGDHHDYRHDHHCS